MKKFIAFLLAACFLLALSGCVNPTLNIQFNKVSKQVQTSAWEINALISQANTLLSNTQITDVENNTVIQNLQTQINNMQTILIQAPQRGADSDAVKAQIEDLEQKVRELEQTQKDLQKAIDDVEASKRAQEERKRQEEERRHQEEERRRQQEEQRRLDVVKPKNTYYWSYTDSFGYSNTHTLKIGSWIKASDTAMLNDAWRAVGGTGDFPTLSELYNKMYGHGSVVRTPLSNSSSAVVFGTLQVSGSISADEAVLAVENVSYLGGCAAFVQDQNGNIVSISNRNPFRAHRSIIGSNVVPLIIVLPQVFTPNYPNGNPALDNITFSFGLAWDRRGETFRIGKTW